MLRRVRRCPSLMHLRFSILSPTCWSSSITSPPEGPHAHGSIRVINSPMVTPPCGRACSIPTARVLPNRVSLQCRRSRPSKPVNSPTRIGCEVYQVRLLGGPCRKTLARKHGSAWECRCKEVGSVCACMVSAVAIGDWRWRVGVRG
jgi:hypothetical protein